MENPAIEDGYEESKKKAKEFYSRIGSVWCPALGDHIAFNSNGFRHLVWKGSERRPHGQQIKRFSLLNCVNEIISRPEVKVTRRDKSEDAVIEWRGKKKKIIRNVMFWALTAEKDGRQIRIIIRQVGKGKKHFLSIFEDDKQKPPHA